MIGQLYTEDPKGDRRDWHNIRRMAPLLWDYRGRALVALICLVLSKVANVGVPLVLKEIVDFLEGTDIERLVLPVTLLIAYGALRLSSSLFNELRDAIFAKVRYRAMRRLSSQVLEHLHRLSLRFHLDRKTGGITRDLERGTRSVSTVLNYMVFNILPTLAEFAMVAIILLTQYDVIFAVASLSTVAVYLTFTFMVTEWRMHYRHDMNRLDSQANSQAVDSLINFETVKYFGNESLELQRYDATLADWEDVAVKSQTSMSALNFGQATIIVIGVTMTMFLATQGVVDGSMSLGDLVLVNAFMLQLFVPLGFLGIVYRQIKYAFADMDLMVRLLEREPEIQDAENASELACSIGEIEFQDVYFGYQDDREILHGISFSVAAGQTVAVVGSSGAGKSTLARLLFRFYDIDQGRILIDGSSVKEVSQASLRAAIGIVPQDTVLFNDTLYFNLVYAKPDATKEEVARAAKMAHIHEFIESLPDGYDTMVGERGLKLSGGEKQRVAIARAILKDPRILIFDEATSSLDSRTEQGIQETLREVSTDRTTLIIAHRLSTIVDADQILVMEDGKIIEHGTHQELIAEDSAYHRMWALQQKKNQQVEMKESV